MRYCVVLLLFTLSGCLVRPVDTKITVGMTRAEVLAITDDIVGDFGKDEVSVCAIVAVEQVLIHNEAEKLKKIVKLYAPYMQFPDE